MIFHQPDNSQSNYNYNGYMYRDTEYSPHFHKNIELIVPLEGSVSVIVNGRHFAAEAGEMVLVLSNQIHAFTVAADARAWVAVFSEEYVPQFARQVSGKQGVTAVFRPDAVVWEMVRRMLISGSRSVMMKKACLYAVCDNYLNSVELENRQEKSSFLVGALLDWVACHYTEPITLKQAAAQFGYEYHYLSRLLNQSYRISFVSLVNSYRVEYAVDLLQQTDLPVSEIVIRSGFQSIRSFNQVFREIKGCSPNACRKAPIDKAAEFS